MHRVVQAVISDRLSDEETAAARRAVHRMVVDARPEGDVDDPQTWRRYRAIWPHLSPSGVMWSADTLVRQLLIERVRYLRQRDDLARGKRRAEEIQRAWRSMLSGIPDPALPGSEQMVRADHPDTLRCRANLLLTEYELGVEGATGKRQEVLAALGALIGDEHPDVTIALGGGRLLCAIDPLPY